MNRVIFLDNLRYLMVLLVVVLHAAISYGNFVPWWCIKDTGSVFIDILLLALDSFLMPILFFIAGYFALPSFRQKGSDPFLRAKFKRLGLPVLIVVPLTSPTWAYLYHYTRNGSSYPVSFPEYWAAYMKLAGDFHIGVVKSIDHFNQSHLWFMSLLLCFFLGFSLVSGRKNPSMADSGAAERSERASGRLILLILLIVGVLSSLSTYTAKMMFAGPSNPQPWISIGPLLLFQPERIIMYLLFFIMGVMAFRQQWFTRSIIPGHAAVWWGSALLFFFGVLAVLKPLMDSFSEEKLLIFVFLRTFFCVWLLIAFSKSAAGKWNHASRISTRLAQNSYHIYIVHFLVVILLQLALSYWTGGFVLVKFGIVTTVSIAVSYGVSHYVIRPYPKRSIAGIYTVFILVLMLTGHRG